MRMAAQLGLAIAAAICGSLALDSPAAAQSVARAPEPKLLTEARENLRISRLTLARIERDLAALRNQAEVDPAVLRDYVIYLDRVKTLTAEHEKVLRSMKYVSGDTPPLDPFTDPREEPEVFRPPLIVVEDELTRLDREFLDSLARFDQFLLDEQAEARRRLEQIEAVSSKKMDALAREAADAVERLRQKGIDVDTSTPPGEGQQEGEGAPGEQPPAGNGEAPEGVPPSGSPPGGGEGTEESGDTPPSSGGGASGTGDETAGDTNAPAGATGDPDGATSRPEDRPPADDDDIVARQLREAAERETDPVLKEKLWREYDKYKRGG